MKAAVLLPLGTQTVAEVRTVIIHLGSRDARLASVRADSENEFLCVAGKRKRRQERRKNFVRTFSE